jgi:hypothetical protein
MVMLGMAMMMLPRVSGLPEHRDSRNRGHKGYRLHAVTPNALHSIFFFASKQKASPSSEQGEAKQTKHLDGSRC